MWCRKCRRFSKNFFCGGRGVAVRKMQNDGVRKLQNIGLLWAKVRMFYIKSTDVCLKEVRCFCFPEKVRLIIILISRFFVCYYCVDVTVLSMVDPESVTILLSEPHAYYILYYSMCVFVILTSKDWSFNQILAEIFQLFDCFTF